jgi:hypothetical protein
LGLYFIFENLVFRVSSETIGYAVNFAASVAGMMEYRPIGMLGLTDGDLILLRTPRIRK